MAFVKLDCGMLDSTLWIDRCARELFITALLMAEPRELTEPLAQIKIRELAETGFMVPPGWFGFVPAASTGIIRRCGMDTESGMTALERLGDPEAESRTPDYEGRRMVRVDGGFIILNYDAYRNKDHTAAERARRYRDRKRQSQTVTPPTVTSRVTSRSVTQAEAEAYSSTGDKPPVGKNGASESRPTVRRLSNGIVDSEWIAKLKQDAAYKGIDIDRELGKCSNWCSVHHKTPSRARFINWLNRVEKPMTTTKPQPKYRDVTNEV